MVDGCEKNTGGHPLLVTAAVVFDNQKVLITKRPEGKRHPDYWEFPGGKVDAGESPQQALKREMLEELGVSVTVHEIFDVVYYRYEWGAVLILAYHCSLLNTKLQKLDVAEYRWVNPSDLNKFKILPADEPIIDRLNLHP